MTRFRPPVGRILTFCFLALAAATLAGGPPRVLADPAGQDGSQAADNRAALVVRFDDDRVETFCISFTEPVIYGDEMLELAGLRPDIANDGRICSVDDAGCSSQDCWCQCNDFNNCTYWAYYRLEDGAWVYSTQGATTSPVSGGDVEAWSWGKGNFVSGVEPPLYTYEAICGVSAPGDQGIPDSNPTPATGSDQPAAPQVTYFQANPPVLAAGACTTLSWSVQSATEVRVDGADAPLQGDQQMCPGVSRSYSLVATNDAGSSMRTLAVQVQGSGSASVGASTPPGVATPPLVSTVPAAPPGTAPAGDPAQPPQAESISPVESAAALLPAPTPFRLAAPPTSTTRPRSALGAGGRPTPTPILLARSAAARPGQPAGASPSASSDRGVRDAAADRSFQASLLPQYAAYLLMVAFLAVLAAVVLRRRARRAEAPAERNYQQPRGP